MLQQAYLLKAKLKISQFQGTSELMAIAAPRP